MKKTLDFNQNVKRITEASDLEDGGLIIQTSQDVTDIVEKK